MTAIVPASREASFAIEGSTSKVGRTTIFEMMPAKATTAMARLAMSGVRIGMPLKAIAGKPKDNAWSAEADASRRKA